MRLNLFRYYIALAICAFVFGKSNAQGAVGESKIARWKDNRPAVFLLMFDDSVQSDYQVAIPELIKRKLIATFYVNPGGNKWGDVKNGAPEQWEQIIPKTGMVYGDHTWTHKGVKDFADADFEIGGCERKIISIFYRDTRPHLVSFGQPGVGPNDWNITKEELKALLDKYHLIDRPPFDAKHGAVFGLKTADEMLALADKAIAENGMEYLIIHGLERRPAEGDPDWKYQDFWALDKDVLRGVLDGLAARRDQGKLWITDHISEYKYQMERDDKPAIQVQTAGEKSVELTLRGSLDQEIFDAPLTVITEVPAAWHGALVTQGALKANVPVQHGAVQYEALLNGVPVILTPAAPPSVGSTH